MTKAMLTLALLLGATLSPQARAQKPELLKVTGVGFSCGMMVGTGFVLFTEDSMGRQRVTPVLDGNGMENRDGNQVIASDRDTHFPIATTPRGLRRHLSALCDEGEMETNTQPTKKLKDITLMKDLKVYLIKEGASRQNADYHTCHGGPVVGAFLGVPSWMSHSSCRTYRGQVTQYTQTTFVLVRKNERVDRQGRSE